LSQSLSPSSHKVYSKAWEVFNQFYRTSFHQPMPFPLSSRDISLFISYLDLLHYARSSIRTYVSALSFSHKMSHLPDPSATFLIKKLLDNAGSRGQSPLPKLPISLTLLHRLLDTLSTLFNPTKAILWQAIFLLAFYLCARMGELTLSQGNLEHIIKADQVLLVKQGTQVIGLKVEFRSYKHSRAQPPSSRSLSSTGSKWCPVQALMAYLARRPLSRHQVDRAPLFLWPDRSPVRISEVNKTLRSCLLHLGEDASRFSSHGFRVGGTTEAAVRGASDSQLRLLGRWKSNAFLSYIRPQNLSFSFS
jgi:hypothetical protein